VSELVLPPWDLCGFDRSYDPYSMEDAEARWRVWASWRDWGVAPALEVERVVDPNGRDGQWEELAFMPHVTERVPAGVERVDIDHGAAVAYRTVWLEVPAYVGVAEALFAENMIRASDNGAIVPGRDDQGAGG
jgi:hypothetical protein